MGETKENDPLGLNNEFDTLTTVDQASQKASVVGPKKIATQPKKVVDPEDDRENWPTIMINTEEGKPNYETVIVHGTKKDGTLFGHDLQIMRGVPVQVPPSVVYDLQDAIATHMVSGKDFEGKQVLRRFDRPSVSWNLIDKGKYVK